MSIVLFQTFPPDVSVDVFEQITEEIDARNNPPDGLLVHTVIERGGNLEVVDVWESQERFETFLQQRLMPAFQAVGQRTGVDLQAAGPPQIEFCEVKSEVRGRL